MGKPAVENSRVGPVEMGVGGVGRAVGRGVGGRPVFGPCAGLHGAVRGRDRLRAHRAPEPPVRGAFVPGGEGRLGGVYGP